MLLPKTVLNDKYEILKEVGRGGMSTVYLAMDTRLNKQWAVKEIQKNAFGNEEIMINSIRIEADILKKADHPVLPRIVDIIYAESAVFVVMDYIEGLSLDKVIALNGAEPAERVVGWAKSLCEALIYLHNMNPPVIYRDMKPSNIMIKPDGNLKLIDFGTAKEFAEGKDEYALGTKGYAAPEQMGDINGRGRSNTDVRADIYALGMTLYYMLTGDDPDNPSFRLKSIRDINPTVCQGLEKIINKCVEKNPDNRYQSCEELLYHLNNYKKLDDKYKRYCRNNIKSFVAGMLITLSFFVVAISGFIGMRKELKEDYDQLMNRGYSYTASGEYEKAIESYMYAITEIDGSRNEAYLALLKLYVNYMDEPEMGLSCVSYYIEQNYKGIGEDEMLISQMAICYFELLKDYKTSAKYFLMLADKEDSFTEGYKMLAMLFSDLNIDNDSYREELLEFERINEEYPDNVKKIINYRLLCDAYSICSLNDIWVLEGLERCAGKGISLISDDVAYEGYDESEYYISFKEYLTLAREGLGDIYADNGKELKDDYYQKAVSDCEELLELITGDDSLQTRYSSGETMREMKYCQEARLYEKLKEFDKAVTVYETAEKEMDSVSVYTGHLSLLCRMESEKTIDVQNWNYEELYALYNRAKNVEDIDKDFRWKRLMVKLKPLFEKYTDQI